MSIRPVSTTMGVSTPASVAEGTRYYRYNGDQPYRGPDRSRDLPQNAKAMSAKQRRMAEYNRLQLEEHLTKEQAAERIGISPSTMHYYERAFKAEHPQEASDA